MVDAIVWDNDDVLVDNEEVPFSATCDESVERVVNLARKRSVIIPRLSSEPRTYSTVAFSTGWLT
jgi:hypothetical protein